jgi:ABC-2 type transport system ATP-binding protein
MVGAPKSQVDELVRDTHLDKQRGQVVRSLSGGQKARVSLAVALLGHPQLLVLDEPTVGLDPMLRKELWDRFHALAQDGKTLIVSSHVMDEAKRCDILILMRDGQLLAQGTPAELMDKTDTHDVESAFLKLVEKAS